MPFAASRKSHGNGSSNATWRRNFSHWTLKPLSWAPRSGTRCQAARWSIGLGMSGFQTGIGVAAAGWIRHSRRPATALPSVPSTCSSNSSSRSTRTHHDEFICTIGPSSISNVA